MKVAVIGGGPAGMLAAISAAKSSDDVTLFEKNNILGKKILITGKGRCNITSSLEIEDFISNIPGNGRFLFSVFQNFSNQDIISMLEKEGVKVKEERGNRIFPVSDRAEDVRFALEKITKKAGVNIKLNSNVKAIEVGEEGVKAVILDNGKFNADKIILATGGKSYPLTGSNGDGYEIAKKVGHSVKEIRGSLVPMLGDNTCSKLQGLSLRNIGIYIYDKENDKKIYEDFGEMLFTHFGVSGPTILSSSAHVLRYKNVDEKMRDRSIILKIDLKPALSIEQLDTRILRDFEEVKNKQFKNSLDKLLPKKMIDVIIEKSKIDPDKKVNEITKEERHNLVNLIKNFEVKLLGFRPVDEAIITAGGISVKEINPKTMESKLVSGLYFAGEIIDVDAYTGGFNLQIAYSTGWTSGMKID
ncbi:MAG: NAD(P)/FAD-dependent oxidoreductase [Clostridia bacterium]|jgi:predicted Rossmann fold flavoprotein|nr:NAD(P)/FAD-dependent oxidoreductase [Clostridia bacterium]